MKIDSRSRIWDFELNMKPFLSCAIAVFAFSALNTLHGQGFIETWEEPFWTVGDNAATKPGSPWAVPAGGGTGTTEIQRNLADAINPSQVLFTQPTEGTNMYIRRFLGPTPAQSAMTGEIIVQFDFSRATANGRSTFILGNGGDFRGTTAVVMLDFGANIQAYSGSTTVDTGQLIGTTNLNDWYRITLNIRLDSADGAASRYDVTVQNLSTPSQNATLTSYTNIPTTTAATQADRVVLASIFNAAAAGRWDNISVVPEPGSALLLLAGSCLLFFRRRRRS